MIVWIYEKVVQTVQHMLYRCDFSDETEIEIYGFISYTFLETYWMYLEKSR